MKEERWTALHFFKIRSVIFTWKKKKKNPDGREAAQRIFVKSKTHFASSLSAFSTLSSMVGFNFNRYVKILWIPENDPSLQATITT